MEPRIVVIVPTERGDGIPVEVAAGRADNLALAARGGDQWPRLARTVEESICLIGPVLDAVGSTLAQLTTAPTKTTAKLSLSVAGELGFAVAKGSSEGAIEITCEWESAADGPAAEADGRSG